MTPAWRVLHEHSFPCPTPSTFRTTALVTGSSQGIGAEIARLLHGPAPGWSSITRTVRRRQDHEGRAGTRRRVDVHRVPAARWSLVADVSDPAAVQAMMQGIRREWGGLDILVNNAGILRDRSIGKMTLEEWRSVIDVNLSGVFYCCKFGLEVMRDGGAIVCVGSLAAKLGFHGQSNYAAAKAGVQALVRVLARECARRSIRVNAVAPGVIDTPMVAQVTDHARGPTPQIDRAAAAGASRRSGRRGPLPLLAAGQLYHGPCAGGRRRIPGMTALAAPQ